MIKIINFDQFVKEFIVMFVIDGQKYDMVEVMVEIFIENMKVVQFLGFNVDLVVEIEVGIGIIICVFLMLIEKQIWSWMFLQIQLFFEFVCGVNGEVVIDNEEVVVLGNDQMVN